MAYLLSRSQADIRRHAVVYFRLIFTYVTLSGVKAAIMLADTLLILFISIATALLGEGTLALSYRWYNRSEIVITHGAVQLNATPSVDSANRPFIAQRRRCSNKNGS